MKKLVLFSLVSAAMCVNAQNGAAIEYKMTSSKGPTGSIKVNYSEWGSSSQFNMNVPQMPGGGVTNRNLVLKDKPDVVYMINDKSKSYSEMKAGETKGSGNGNDNYTVKKVGEEKVNGYKCMHAVVTKGNETHEVWNTKDIADYQKYAAAFASDKKIGDERREKALKDAGCDGIPVKVLHRGSGEEGEFTMELVKVEKKTWSKSDFEIPAGYTRNESASNPAGGPGGMKSQQDLMNMTPEERAKYIEEMKKMYGK